MNSTGAIDDWLDATAAAVPGRLHLFNLAVGASSDGFPSLTVYQLPSVEEVSRSPGMLTYSLPYMAGGAHQQDAPTTQSNTHILARPWCGRVYAR